MSFFVDEVGDVLRVLRDVLGEVLDLIDERRDQQRAEPDRDQDQRRVGERDRQPALHVALEQVHRPRHRDREERGDHEPGERLAAAGRSGTGQDHRDDDQHRAQDTRGRTASRGASPPSLFAGFGGAWNRLPGGHGPLRSAVHGARPWTGLSQLGSGSRGSPTSGARALCSPGTSGPRCRPPAPPLRAEKLATLARLRHELPRLRPSSASCSSASPAGRGAAVRVVDGASLVRDHPSRVGAGAAGAGRAAGRDRPQPPRSPSTPGTRRASARTSPDSCPTSSG